VNKDLIEKKLTQKDVTKWCSSHYCNEHDCKYMRDYCHIEEHVIEECNECISMMCQYCNNYK